MPPCKETPKERRVRNVDDEAQKIRVGIAVLGHGKPGGVSGELQGYVCALSCCHGIAGTRRLGAEQR